MDKKNFRFLIKVFAWLLLSALIILIPPARLSAADDLRVVKSSDGLRMREQPNLMARVLAVIPDAERVNVLSEADDETVIMGVRGKWVRVTWKNNTGWVFSGFLEKFVRTYPCEGWEGALTDNSLNGYYGSSGIRKLINPDYDTSLEMAFDGKDESAWITDTKKGGEGVRIGFFFREMKYLEILPGIGKKESFEKYSRVKNAVFAVYRVSKKVESICGTRYILGEMIKLEKLSFNDKMKREKFDISFEKDETGYVGVLEITEIYPGKEKDKFGISTIRVKSGNEYKKADNLVIAGLLNFQSDWISKHYGKDGWKFFKVTAAVGKDIVGTGKLVILSDAKRGEYGWIVTIPLHILQTKVFDMIMKEKIQMKLLRLNDDGIYIIDRGLSDVSFKK